MLHAHFGNMGIIAAKLKTRVGIPLVITEHSSAINKEEIRSQRFLKTIQSSYSKSDCLIAVSQLWHTESKTILVWSQNIFLTWLTKKSLIILPVKPHRALHLYQSVI